MSRLINKLNPFWVIVLVFFTWAAFEQSESSSAKGARRAMQTYYIGRFSIQIPALMEEKLRSSKLRSVDVQEMPWPKGAQSEHVRAAEWERFVTDVKKLEPPEDKDGVIIKRDDFPGTGKWSKGIFYYNDHFDREAAQWRLLFDAGPTGVWFTGDPTIVEKEMLVPKMAPNLQTIAKAYSPFDPKHGTARQPDNRFYLQHGAINLPYSCQEEAIARFEGHPLKLTLLIEMEMDFTKERETMGLIEGTKEMLLASLVTPGGSISKVRLRKREVGGMPGEESVLKVTEGQDKHLVFTWQYNGKDDSGEYPATHIEMESPGGNLGEKLEIWDAILNSMKPMFERKRS